MMMRIIAGEFRGRLLASPKGESTRPTSGLVREAVFNICQSFIAGQDFLDICAGSGAMGFEALSRGAASVVFIENDVKALAALKKNIEALGVQDRVVCLKGSALAMLKRMNDQGRTFGIIYADPPYDAFKLYQDIACELDRNNLLKPNGDLFIEESLGAPDFDNLLQHLTLKNCRQYGKSQLRHYERMNS